MTATDAIDTGLQVALIEMLEHMLDDAYELIEISGGVILPDRDRICMMLTLDRYDRSREMIRPSDREASQALWELMIKLPDWDEMLALEQCLRRRCNISVRMLIEPPWHRISPSDVRILRSLKISPL